MRRFFVQFFCRTIRESFQYFQVAKVSDLIFLFSRFLIEVLHSSKTTVLCCRILTFWSNLAFNIVSTARNDLCFTICLEAILNPEFKKYGKIRQCQAPARYEIRQCSKLSSVNAFVHMLESQKAWDKTYKDESTSQIKISSKKDSSI